MTYSVYVDDNFHYMDESERYHLGDYTDHSMALQVCRQIVDEYLESAYKPGMSAAELYDTYTSFGSDPWIKTNNAAVPRFSAWGYAKKRCEELCEARPS